MRVPSTPDAPRSRGVDRIRRGPLLPSPLAPPRRPRHHEGLRARPTCDRAAVERGPNPGGGPARRRRTRRLHKNTWSASRYHYGSDRGTSFAKAARARDDGQRRPHPVGFDRTLEV